MARYKRKVSKDEVRNHLNDKRYKDPALKLKLVVKCKCCGKRVEKHYWRVKDFKYCSKECREKGKRTINKNINWKSIKKKKAVFHTFVCQNPNCKKEYKRTGGQVKHNLGIKYCSHKCYTFHSHLKVVEKKMLIQRKSNQELNGINVNDMILDKDSFYNSILSLNKKV